MLKLLIGLIPAVVIRWGLLRRPVSLWPAIGLSVLIGMGLLAFWQVMGDKLPTTVGAAGVISFFILWGRATSRRADQPVASNPESSALTPNQSIQHPESAPPTSLSCPTSISDESLFEQAMNEVQSGTTRPGLWAKAFSLAQGEESKSKALYIQYRVEQLQGEREAAKEPATLATQERVQIKNGTCHQVEGEETARLLNEQRDSRAESIARLAPVLIKAMFILPPLAGVFGFFGGLQPFYGEGRAGLIFQDGFGAGLSLFGITLLLIFILWFICWIIAKQCLKMKYGRK